VRVLIVEPYFTGSHAAWAEGYRRYSRHDVNILALPGASWKWRMHGGAVTLARRFGARGLRPDVILATDMLDLTTFQSLTRTTTHGVPFALYFHENQLCYPWSPTDRDVAGGRDKHYGFINYASALAAEAVFFNSAYHMRTFFGELTRFLSHFPDHRELASVEEIRARSSVLPLGLDLARFDATAAPLAAGDGAPLVVWNHRWEYDKNPGEFFAVLDALAGRGVEFRVAILGECFSRSPDEFTAARERLGERVVAFGYAEDFGEYAAWLRAARVVPVTSRQDFFGASIVEAVYCGCHPLLPRRLAYPDVIPADFHAGVFYDDARDLERRLEAVLAGGPPPAARSLGAAMRRYDWSVLAPEYDGRLEDLWKQRSVTS
jgi:glycosyltransferase involved in cell wall biosynthesis